MKDLTYSNINNARLKEIIHSYEVLFENPPLVYLIKGKYFVSTKYGTRKEVEIKEDNPVPIYEVKTIYLIGKMNGKVLRFEPINNTECTYRIKSMEE